jgi:hypothetical protein
MKSSHGVVSRILAAKSIRDILMEQNEGIHDLFSALLITIYVTDKPRNELYSLYPAGPLLKEIRLPITNRSIAGYVANTGRGINIADAYDKEELKKIDSTLYHNEAWDKQTGYHTMQVLALPIMYENTLFGVIQMINRKGGGKFSAEEQTLLEEIAGAFGIALYNQHIISSRRKTRFDYLVIHNLMNEADLEAAFTESRRSNEPIEELLMKRFRISREDMGRSLEHYYGCRYIPFSTKHPLPEDLLGRLRIENLRRELWVPLGKNADGRISVIVNNPNDISKQCLIEKSLLTRSIEYCVSLEHDIRLFIHYFFQVNPLLFTENIPDEIFAPPCMDNTVHTAEAIAKRLKMLADSPEPRVQNASPDCLIGLDTGFPETLAASHVEYVCPLCRDITVYACDDPSARTGRDYGRVMIRPEGEIRISEPVAARLKVTMPERRAKATLFLELKEFRKMVKEIHGINVAIDENQLCHTCRTDVKEPALTLKVDYGNFCKVTAAIEKKDLQILADFMTGKAQTDGPNWRNEEALKGYLPRLEELLGVRCIK